MKVVATYEKSAIDEGGASGESSQNNFEKLSDDVVGREVCVPALQGLADDDEKCVSGGTRLLVAGLDAKNGLRNQAVDEARTVILKFKIFGVAV